MTTWQRESAMIEAIAASIPQPRDWSVDAEEIRQWRAEDAANGEPWADDNMKEGGCHGR